MIASFSDGRRGFVKWNLMKRMHRMRLLLAIGTASGTFCSFSAPPGYHRRRARMLIRS